MINWNDENPVINEVELAAEQAIHTHRQALELLIVEQALDDARRIAVAIGKMTAASLKRPKTSIALMYACEALCELKNDIQFSMPQTNGSTLHKMSPEQSI